MEDSANLLDEFVPKESEIMIYQRKYAIFRKIGLLVAGYAFTIFAIAVLVIARGFVNTDIPLYFLLGGLVFITIIAVGASLLGFILAVFIDKKFPYRHRYAKSFWIMWLLVSSIYAVIFSIKAFDVFVNQVKEF